MKNLKLQYQNFIKIEPNSVYLTTDTEANKLYTCTTNSIFGYDLLSFKQVFELNLSKKDLTPNGEVEITGLQFMLGEEKLCVSLKHGDIVLCSTVDGEIECVGTLDCEVESMVWSPDQEIVLFITNRATAVAMTHDFDPIAEIEVGADTFGEGEFINNVDTGIVIDDCKIKIVWRSDGQYFAVSSVENGSRKLRTWNRDCVLQYTSEGINGLESSLAWKPTGSLIASTQMKAHRHDVVFFELNGLQHGEFTLKFERNSVDILKLEWNADSSVLMVLGEDRKGSNGPESKKTYLQLWASTNYHWGMKQSLIFNENVNFASWDVENPFDLHILLQNGEYYKYTWSWEVDSSGVYSVVDGCNLKLTPFKYMNTPPPMCAYQYKFKSSVKTVTFLQDFSTPDNLCVLTEDNALFVFSKEGNFTDNDVETEMVAAGGKGFKTTVGILKLSAKFMLSQEVKGFNLQELRHLVWVDQFTLVAVSSQTHSDVICIFTLDFVKSSYVCEPIKQVSGQIVAVCSVHIPEKGSFTIVQMHDGNVVKYEIPTLYQEPWLDSRGSPVVLSNICSKMRVCSFKNPSDDEPTYVLLSLSAQKQLFLNNTVISRECTSFAIHNEYVLYTTSSHKLICISRSSDISDLEKQHSNAAFSTDHQISCCISRTVERGSTIVTVTPNDTKVVVQMPRGNLELIHPRPLVLSVVKRAIDGICYKDAFVLMRKHRLNMNLLYDHAPGLFMGHVNEFIAQLDSVDYLNLFLSELKDENVTETMYSQYYPNTKLGIPGLLTTSVNNNKVNLICEKILTVLNAKENNKYFLSVLTAYVRKIPANIDQALGKIRDLKENSNSTLVADGLRHLHVMVEGRVLYREALATYDLELALMVAQVSNDDPKEYMPFLNKLQQMELNHRNYEIDMFLKKFSHALVNISKCPDRFADCIELVKAHNLHREALRLFGRFTPQYKEISNLYAEFLTSKHAYEEAGFILARCDNHKRAIKCFVASCNWQHALHSASHLNYSTEEQELANSLANALMDKSRFLEAANILDREAKDPVSSIQALIKGRHWEDTLNMIRTHKLLDLVDSCVLPAIQEAMREMETSIKTYSEQFERYFNRLLVVREIKKQKQLHVNLESDIASDFGSTVTGSSRSSASSRASGRTAKSRRKQERKRFSLREGSRFEEEGLLQALKESLTSLSTLRCPLQSLLLHASLFHMDKEAESLQSLYHAARSVSSKNIPNIWVLPDSTSLNATGPQSTVNSILSSRVGSTAGEPQSFADLEVFIPP
uniref:Elongator complex protein 1 n=1 Tax=Ciona savignyi TaxID=51511 RepID=H2YH47_CIOSA